MKIAVVGSGVSGLAATWLLNEYSDHEVHLYESESRIGGHAHTVQFSKTGPNGQELVNVDVGFIVLNPTTYPNFLSFLGSQPSVKLNRTEMTFSVSRNNGQFEWAGDTIFTVFCQGLRRILDPGMWTMLYDILRFNCKTRVLLQRGQGPLADMTIGEYLSNEGYSDEFIQNYLIPMTAAIWSTPPSKAFASFPARSLLHFLRNHHLLQITGKPKWLTIKGGSKTYIETILSRLTQNQIHLSSPVAAVATSTTSDKGNRKVYLTVGPDGRQEQYDHVILATHSNTSLEILRAGSRTSDEMQAITPLEESILSVIEWNDENEVVLHSDDRLMPQARSAWSCWNYMDLKGKQERDTVCLTYGMNDLQHIPYSPFGPVLVTLNPPKSSSSPPRSIPDPQTVQYHIPFSHPVLSPAALASQSRLRDIQGKRGIGFAGAWMGWGFHEDGWVSGSLAAIHAMELLGRNKPPPNGTESGDVKKQQHGSHAKNSRPKPPTIVLAPESPFLPWAAHLRDSSAVYVLPVQKKWDDSLVLILERFFDMFEATGCKAFVGIVFGWAFGLLRVVFGVEI